MEADLDKEFDLAVEVIKDNSKALDKLKDD
jgi:hypothetical protein